MSLGLVSVLLILFVCDRGNCYKESRNMFVFLLWFNYTKIEV